MILCLARLRLDLEVYEGMRTCGGRCVGCRNVGSRLPIHLEACVYVLILGILLCLIRPCNEPILPPRNFITKCRRLTDLEFVLSRDGPQGHLKGIHRPNVGVILSCSVLLGLFICLYYVKWGDISLMNREICWMEGFCVFEGCVLSFVWRY